MSDILPLLTSHHSLGSSILTVEKETEIDPNKPVSVFAIAKKHKMEQVVLVEEDISGFWKSYKAAKELGIQLIYGIKMTVCSDMADKSDESLKTESKVIVFFRNSKSYYKFVKPYSIASTTGMLKERQLDWAALQSFWNDDEFILGVPFYSSFLARNLTRLNHKALPDFGAIKPLFFEESHGHCYDDIITKAIHKYCGANNYEIQKAHQVYYYSKADALKYLCIKCIQNRSTFDKPKIAGAFCSEEFSFESYLNKIGEAL